MVNCQWLIVKGNCLLLALISSPKIIEILSDIRKLLIVKKSVYLAEIIIRKG